MEQDAPQFNIIPTTKEKPLPDGRIVQFIIFQDEDKLFRAWISAYRYDDRKNPVYVLDPFKTSAWQNADDIYNTYFRVAA